ncbi:putative bifunctional diguanylate cyclase/phosphodiesterase [Acetobacterium woodii]|uniref:Diguanylate cyclase/phosphodiesterase n=1 Tax=Acetobacterium woodii (strain ATCC 29683 / DSM 1030 / JCM 2381 / KCTC 1655 / WB1) TaxID=931626 RepID=H6LDN4_ACEWD|nr:bifunctional diguanylate cyclase/phosphodiesterase [Acetobacterium woodii]AFA49198.1 hypothetical protein Awo_c24410 [Acetobacterium woodii DSM 1030]
MNYSEKKSLVISFALFILVIGSYFFKYNSQIYDKDIIAEVIFGVAFGSVLLQVVFSNFAHRDLKKEVDQLRLMQERDWLTGCLSRNKFKKECEKILEKNKDQTYAMIIFDIDKFKAINDLHGHQTGDKILYDIAKILEKQINEDELFSRIATDNFNVLIKYQDYLTFSKRIEKMIGEINGYSDQWKINISMGIYLIGEAKLGICNFSDRANMAKRSIKDNALVSYAFYDESMRLVMIRENEIENKMEAALRNEEFELYLQPKYLFLDEKIIGAEALVRWNDPILGIISPNDFIPLFEKNGFVKKIDAYMFEKVCKLLHKWKIEMDQLTDMIISVNFSRVHLNNLFLPEELFEIASRYKIDPQKIEIELTEGTIFDNDIQMIEIMKHLKNIGFHISIDDFGRAYSSLNTLRNLPADILKLDKAFFSESADDQRGKKIITSMLNMARDLNLVTVAEGVETKEQVEFLKERGCDIAQGFYYAKPMKVVEFEAFVNKKLKSA